MVPVILRREDRVGLVRPSVDAHTLGLASMAHLLGECGYTCFLADAQTCDFLNHLESPEGREGIVRWIAGAGITILGFSYRLDPGDGAALFERLYQVLADRRILAGQGGSIRGVFFAGLPDACRRVKSGVPAVSGVFQGDETPAEALRVLGIAPTAMPQGMLGRLHYDEDRLAFGRDIVRAGSHLALKPVDRSGYEGFGTRADTLVARLNHARRLGQPPLTRAHVGPYLPDRSEAVALFLNWTRQLAAAGLLDVLSIGTSQLSQSEFGEDWTDRPNGGGVPIHSAEEFASVWQAARPMLVRTYAGTNRIPALAAMYERTMNIAWHALSFWWFCRLDGRGPLPLDENLRQHLETVSYVASTGKPLEANVAHHFSFRGADDVTAIVATILAARAAKALGVRHFVLQVMLNTPKFTWGIQDLAKARAMLRLARELEDDRFRVILQPRGGLDYFSPDMGKARAQLAAVTALMDDIEPGVAASPDVIHVVSFSEANHLADPDTVNESIRLTQYALQSYRRLRAKGEIDDMGQNVEVAGRTERLLAEARALLDGIASVVPAPHTAAGLNACFEMGFLPVPDLWAERDRFPRAAAWRTKPVQGCMELVDEDGEPIAAADRVRRVLAWRAERESGSASG